MLAGLAAPEWFDLGVAFGTLALAGATGWMAWKVRDQAGQTRRLAEIAERQLEATTTPVVRVMRVERASQADIVTVNKGASNEKLVVRFENRGSAPAGLEQFTMIPGGAGNLASSSLENPILGPNGEWDVDFDPSEAAKAAHAEGKEVLIGVRYEAIGTGVRYSRRTYVKRDLDASYERWMLLREDAPVRE